MRLRFQFYPRAREQRVSASHVTLRQPRREFFKAAIINFCLLQVLFFSLFCYLYGTLYRESTHIHNLRIVYVDYDGGIVGQSVRNAYNTLRGRGFPTLIERSPADFPSPGDIRRTVCHIQYWAAVYTARGASDRLATALLVGGSTAADFNKSDVLFYIWNEARYPAVVDSTISNNLKTLSSTATAAYARANSSGVLGTLRSPESLSLYADPWKIVGINLQRTAQGSRLIYNTIAVILIFVQEFCYLGIINGLYSQFKLYNRLYPTRVILVRVILSALFTFSGSLFSIVALWAFRAGWHVNANQFVLNWMILWLFAHLNFLTLDFFTVWLPPFYTPLALISWAILNIASILFPYELSPGFFKWSYVLPAHSLYQTEIDIWSRGCNPQLWYTLPVMFTIEITSLTLSSIGVYRRCHYARVIEEAEEIAMQQRLAAAMAGQPVPQAPPGEEHITREPTYPGIAPTATEEQLMKEDEALARERTRSSNVYYGPSFGLALTRSTRTQGW
ncbi:hypothetical protein MPDQ_000383 [Monascus purpureus]|uniref:DUF3533 domain-containing protein n=1 Tax=Monascus purpureus TaxID=5098 RepID=A0A507QTW7_MONPU|nr:hypothetical protein MPDQ_000383 [Monascus purpureus]BDD61277.1 hypothetical protein MAP00_006336 [Monascus purpureus]